MGQPDQGPQERWSLETLIEEYGDRVYNIALRITGSREEAEDAAQDAFLSAFRQRDTFRGESRLSTWLYRIAVNAALQRVRRLHPEMVLQKLDYERLEVPDWSADVARRAERAELFGHIESGISRLPEDLRVVLVLRDLDGLSSAEAAEVLELSVAALKSRLHRARALLRVHLSDVLDDPDPASA